MTNGVCDIRRQAVWNRSTTKGGGQVMLNVQLCDQSSTHKRNIDQEQCRSTDQKIDGSNCFVLSVILCRILIDDKSFSKN